jgi:hypothetical protein
MANKSKRFLKISQNDKPHRIKKFSTLFKTIHIKYQKEGFKVIQNDISRWITKKLVKLPRRLLLIIEQTFFKLFRNSFPMNLNKVLKVIQKDYNQKIQKKFWKLSWTILSKESSKSFENISGNLAKESKRSFHGY